jgi:hypothetical protein
MGTRRGPATPARRWAAMGANRPFSQPNQGLIKTGAADLAQDRPRPAGNPAAQPRSGPDKGRASGVAEGPADGATSSINGPPPSSAAGELAGGRGAAWTETAARLVGPASVETIARS